MSKGSLLGITSKLALKGQKLSKLEKVNQKKPKISYGDQFIAEKILMFHRHSKARVKLIRREIMANTGSSDQVKGKLK